MTAMEVHDWIGQGIVIVLLAATGLAAVVAMVIMLSRIFQSQNDALLDVCDSHLKTADGKAWKFLDTPNRSGAPRTRFTTPAYHNGDTEYHKDKGVVERPEPDDDIEIIPEDDPEPEEVEVIDFTAPDYDTLKRQASKPLKPKLITKW